MTLSVLCLRPEADFQRAGALPPQQLKVFYRAVSDADIPQIMRQAQALVIPAVGPKLPSEWFEDTSVRFVQVTGAGLDRLDQAMLKRAGIEVANVPGGSNNAVAEYAVTCASLLLRRFSWASDAIRKGNYASFRTRMLSDNLAGVDGLLIGVIGLGVIGMAVARAFHRSGSRICYFDPAPRFLDEARDLGFSSLALPELLNKADVVSLHVPLVPSTRNLLGECELASMKSGAILINASRGGVVDESALVNQLRLGHLGGAAVDVYSTEPPAHDNPLLLLDGEAAQKLILTPHIAGVTRQSAAFLMNAAWKNVERVLIDKLQPFDRVC